MRRFALPVALLCLLSLSLSAQTHQDINNAFGLVSSTLISATYTMHSNGDIDVAAMVNGAPMTLHLTPHSVRAPGFKVVVDDGSRRIEVPAPAEATYRGTVLENPTDEVFASVHADGVRARIIHANGTDHFVQPISPTFPQAPLAAHVLYARADIASTAANNCVEIPAPVPAGTLNPWMPDLSTAELGIDCDWEYYKSHGSNVNNVVNQVTSVITTMNGQYQSQVGITHAITTIVVRTSRIQPYKGKNATSLLNKLRTEWQSGASSSIQHDVAQLFTGKSISGNTIGIAWVGAVCTSYKYSMVESDFNNNFGCATDLSAHELGHNWSAGHCSCPSYTMNPYITCANNFSSVSISAIISHRNSRNCLN